MVAPQQLLRFLNNILLNADKQVKWSNQPQRHRWSAQHRLWMAARLGPVPFLCPRRACLGQEGEKRRDAAADRKGSDDEPGECCFGVRHVDPVPRGAKLMGMEKGRG